MNRNRAAFMAVIISVLLLVSLQRPAVGPARAAATRTQSQPQSPAKAAPNAPADPTAGVEITAQALPPSKFCALGDNGYVVYLPLDITVANGRRTPIILTRYLHIQRVLIGKSSDDVQAARYELATPVRAYRSFGDGVNFGPQPSDDSFVVLKHNQTYEFTAVEGIPVRNNPSGKKPGTAYPGSLAMSIELQTWPFLRNPTTVQTAWAKFGDLISAPVISFPTLVTLPANPPVEKCGLLAP